MQFLPLCMSLTYFFLLPPLSAFTASSPFAASDDLQGGSSSSPLLRRSLSDGEPSADEEEEEDEDEEERLALKELQERETLPSLTTREKIELARPLVKRFMLPLFFVYLAGAFGRLFILSSFA